MNKIIDISERLPKYLGRRTRAEWRRDRDFLIKVLGPYYIRKIEKLREKENSVSKEEAS